MLVTAHIASHETVMRVRFGRALIVGVRFGQQHISVLVPRESQQTVFENSQFVLLFFGRAVGDAQINIRGDRVHVLSWTQAAQRTRCGSHEIDAGLLVVSGLVIVCAQFDWQTLWMQLDRRSFVPRRRLFAAIDQASLHFWTSLRRKRDIVVNELAKAHHGRSVEKAIWFVVVNGVRN